MEEVTADTPNARAAPAGAGTAAVGVDQELISAVPLDNPTVSPPKLPTATPNQLLLRLSQRVGVENQLYSSLWVRVSALEILPNKETGVPEVIREGGG